MSLNKRVKGDFVIESIDSADSVYIKSQKITIQGLDQPDVTAGNFVVGVIYAIKSIGTTDFTLIGATSNTVGEVFTATGAGSGTGVATPEPVNEILINGHLTVTGNTNTLTTTDTNINDNYMTLNAGETGSGVTLGTSGILIDRGIAANGDAGIRFNDSSLQWEFNYADGAGWQTISAVSGSFAVVDDTTPQLGGDLDVNGYAITSASNGNIVLQANGTGMILINQELSLQEQATDETPVAGYNKLYAKTPANGGTGLYVANSTTVDEVMSFKKAFILSLIF